MPDLRYLQVGDIEQDPDNPRLVFPEEELQRLAASIAEQGILVPVVVHPVEDKYRLIDGDRRWQCARQLGLEEMPAIIIDELDELSKLIQMFNIHQVREQWQDMPTARALGKLIERTGIKDDRELSNQTGLSQERVKRLRHALELPSEYQQLIFDGEIPLNFFWELKKNIVDPIERRRPDLFRLYGASSLQESFVKKRRNGTITDVVSLRKVRPIINISADDIDNEGSSELDSTLRELIEGDASTIEDAYDETVMVIVEAPKLRQRSLAVVKGFRRLLAHASSDDERGQVISIAEELISELRVLITESTS